MNMSDYCLKTYEYLLEFGGKVKLNIKDKKEWCDFYNCLCELEEEKLTPAVYFSDTSAEWLKKHEAFSSIYSCLFDKMSEMVEGDH